MPSIRVGFSSDLNITGGNTGIGTATPTARLEVSNGIVAERAAGGGGISTFKEYQGFSQTLATLPHEIATEEGVFSSLTGEIKITGETTVSSGSTVEVGKTKTLTVTDKFSVPLGDTSTRDNAPEAGTTRFNQDFGTLEFFDGANWKTVNSYARGGAAGRGVHGGGLDPTNLTRIEYITISSTGNAQNFGDLTLARNQLGACASSTRGIFFGGQPNTDRIDYITIASEGNAIDFGNTSSTRMDPKGVSSSTRGIFGGGFTAGPTTAVNVIDYIEIATVGNALDFGDLKTAGYGHSSCGSPTRGIFLGGNPARLRIIESITIASKGNSVDYGDCDETQYASGCSNSVRGIFFGNSPYRRSMQYLNITTNGNSIEFGDAAHDANESSACASPIRGVCMGGRSATSPNPALDNISYMEISSLGDGVDFGDLSVIVRLGGSLSDSHGGLGGF